MFIDRLMFISLMWFGAYRIAGRLNQLRMTGMNSAGEVLAMISIDRPITE